MALIIPTASSTFADSTKTEGHPLSRKYVLAQFRSDADFEWVRLLRSFLVTEELKFALVREARPKLKSQRDVWKKIEAGVGQATIIVIDPAMFEDPVRESLESGKLFARDGITEKKLDRKSVV